MFKKRGRHFKAFVNELGGGLHESQGRRGGGAINIYGKDSGFKLRRERERRSTGSNLASIEARRRRSSIRTSRYR